jgi:hypothetical protein
MKRIQVIHNGKRKSIPENEAKVLLLLKKATLAPAPAAPPLVPIEVPAPVPAPAVEAVWPFPTGEAENAAGAMESIAEGIEVAEPAEVAASPAVENPASELSPRTGKPKRQYRRRDMQAEGNE